MRVQPPAMRPQDIVILLKIVSNNETEWYQQKLAKSLSISQSEVSQSVVRSKIAGLIDESGKLVYRISLVEFLQYGIRYVFPAVVGTKVRGVPTAFSTAPFISIFPNDTIYVWPTELGTIEGQGLRPLYDSVSKAIRKDKKLHQLLALVDVVRIGNAQERELAIHELKARIFGNHY